MSEKVSNRQTFGTFSLRHGANDAPRERSCETICSRCPWRATKATNDMRESGSRNVGELLTNRRRERTTLHMVQTAA